MRRVVLRHLSPAIGRSAYPSARVVFAARFSATSRSQASVNTLRSKGKARQGDPPTPEKEDAPLDEWHLKDLDPLGERVVKAVWRRVQEKERIAQELSSSNNAHSPEHIQRAKRVKELTPLTLAWDNWASTKELLRELEPMLKDPDPQMASLATAEIASLRSTLQTLISTSFPGALVKSHSTSTSSSSSTFSAIIELKSGVGGDEASLFLGTVLRMYTRLASTNGFKPSIVSSTALEGSGGGYKEALLEVEGEGSYDLFRWETGVHRVQRVPATETSGRTHTSTITVLVLPSQNSSNLSEEADVLNEKDVRIDVMRSRGAGGQHVNRTESAVRLTHEPTGITVSMQDSRSQHQNKAKAFQILRARLLDRKMTEEAQMKKSIRRSMIRSADRSEKIRTYNFSQDRVTDHRIGMSLSNLDLVLEGEGLMPLVDGLRLDHERAIMDELLED